MKWICSQIGAREHYAVPRVIERSSRLEMLYTDFWAGRGWRVLGKLVGFSGMSSRWHPDLANACVKGFNARTLCDRFGGRRSGNPYTGFLRDGAAFGRRVSRSLENGSHSWRKTVFFGYDTGFLEPARLVRERGGATIVCQMDPARFESDLVRDEEKLWPGWAKRAIDVPEAYFRRRGEEWEAADLVVVNSEWTKKALMRQGVPEGKITIVPLAYETPLTRSRKTECNAGSSTIQPFNEQNPLKVLFLGQVILRKGIQYLAEAAELLSGEPVRFDVVGPLGISEKALAMFPGNIMVHGRVSGGATAPFFESADVFVLPTLSDGFAITQLEAMARGLPVISTPNCGEVVTHGSDGMIVPPRDARALADAILGFIREPEKVRAMGVSAIAKSSQFGLARLGEELRRLETMLEMTSSHP